MATDLAEFVGAAVGINLLFGVPLLPAGLITAVVAFLILGLQQRGYRRFELAIIALLALVVLGFRVLLRCRSARPSTARCAACCPACGGAGTSPHRRDHRRDRHAARGLPALGADQRPGAVPRRRERRTLLRFEQIGLPHRPGAGRAGQPGHAVRRRRSFHTPGLTGLSDLGRSTPTGHLAGGGAALAFGVALMASGPSSSSVGTYAGQIVMAGFINWRIPLWPAAR